MLLVHGSVWNCGLEIMNLILSRLYINYWNEIADIFCEMKWYFYYSSFVISSLFWNKMTSFLHSSFVSFHDSWLGYRLVTCHEMKLKTREEMMSFHSTKWWNNSRLVMKYHFIPQKMSSITHLNKRGKEDQIPFLMWCKFQLM